MQLTDEHIHKSVDACVSCNDILAELTPWARPVEMPFPECRGHHSLFVTDYERDMSGSFKLFMCMTTVITRRIVIVFLI